MVRGSEISQIPPETGLSGLKINPFSNGFVRNFG